MFVIHEGLGDSDVTKIIIMLKKDTLPPFVTRLVASFLRHEMVTSSVDEDGTGFVTHFALSMTTTGHVTTEPVRNLH